MLRIVKIMGLPLLGIAIIIAGFIYDACFAGIPYQDPTPELQASWEFNRSVAETFYSVGGIVLLLGLLAAPFIARASRRKISPE